MIEAQDDGGAGARAQPRQQLRHQVAGRRLVAAAAEDLPQRPEQPLLHLAPAQVRDRLPRGDPEQPRLELALRHVALAAAVGLDEDLLRDVLGQRRVEHDGAHRAEHRLVARAVDGVEVVQ